MFTILFLCVSENMGNLKQSGGIVIPILRQESTILLICEYIVLILIALILSIRIEIYWISEIESTVFGHKKHKH